MIFSHSFHIVSQYKKRELLKFNCSLVFFFGLIFHTNHRFKKIKAYLLNLLEVKADLEWQGKN